MIDTDAQCKRCGRYWGLETEQYACIEVYGKCIVCCVENEKDGFAWSIKKVLEKQNEILREGKS